MTTTTSLPRHAVSFSYLPSHRSRIRQHLPRHLLHSPLRPALFSVVPSSNEWFDDNYDAQDEEDSSFLTHSPQSSCNNDYNDNDASLIDSLEKLKDEILRQTGNASFNVKSPKQVSVAIFGTQRACTKQVLQDAAMDVSLPEDKRRLALMILKYKLFLQQRQKDRLINSSLNSETVTGYQVEEVNQTTRTLTTTVSSATTEPLVSTSKSPMTLLSSSPSTHRNPQAQNTWRSQPKVLSHDQIVEALFATHKSKIDPFWKRPLLELSRPVARELLLQLNFDLCPLGFDPEATPQRKSALFASGMPVSRTSSSSIAATAGRKGTFLSFVREQKKTYPQCITLVRCGDFYETYGTDAILLVEHAGLNSMGGKVKAGCPYRNIQSTLDCLTQQGFSVAVFEETGQVVTKGSNAKLKDRILTQIVSPASPIYLYDNWLLEGNAASGASNNHQALDGLPPSRPCVGVIHTASGYNLVEVSLEERSVLYSERLTAEAVACRLMAYPPADPLLYIPTPFEQKEASSKGNTPFPSFLPNPRSRYSASRETQFDSVVDTYLGGYRVRIKVLLPHLVPTAEAGRSDADRFIQTIVETFLDINERQQHVATDKEECGDGSTFRSILHRQETADDFTVSMISTATNPLYVETATQVGLMNDKTIPSLIQYVLDDAAPVASRRFLQRYLLIPPSPPVAQSMAQLVKALMCPDHATSLPPIMVPNLGKMLSLVRAGQAGANVYGEILQSLVTTLYILQENGSHEKDGLPLGDLLKLCQHESGLPAERESLIARCQAAISTIEAVVSSSYHVGNDSFNYFAQFAVKDSISHYENIPDSFFERNELTWRDRVQPAVATQAYDHVAALAKELSAAIQADFAFGAAFKRKDNIVYDIFDNLLSLKSIPQGVPEEAYIHPRDRHGKLLRNRWTTRRVDDILSNYVEACEEAKTEVSSVLSRLAETIQDEGHVPAIVQSAHFNLILSTAFHHAAKAVRSGWQLAETIEHEANKNVDAHFVDVSPYWMDRTSAVSNTFDMSSIFLLTAPNMSGKSTLMRSTAAAALLTVCGLCAPLSCKSQIPRFDTLFLRGASADVPTEDKSAFGAEMGDLSALFRCCGPKSFVFVDELGRGTSPFDGTRLAGAVLEAMAERGMSGIFATHLHGIIELNLRGRDRIVLKRMGMSFHEKGENQQDGKSYEWTYKLEDGVCTDSLALVTAERFGLPPEIIRRANELGQEMDDISRCEETSERSEPLNLSSEHQNRGNVVRPKMGQYTGSFSSTKIQSSERNTHFECILAKAIGILPEAKVVSIPPLYLPPATLNNQSCLYLVQLTKDPPSYYVGETDNLPQRLQQHRKKGGAWKHCRVAAFPFHDKTNARYWESVLIQELAQSGYRLESISDGRSARQIRE